ncbi:MAG TPA: hypothetical protein VJM50_21075, partial [Pyrinomonadaceae bacterium]|nr:hypothetical protein [Pyrinomonadaceae bacterium]
DVPGFLHVFRVRFMQSIFCIDNREVFQTKNRPTDLHKNFEVLISYLQQHTKHIDLEIQK